MSQGVYNAYGGQQYLPIYVPGAVNTPVFPYNQLGQAVPGSQSYTPLQGYAMPGHQVVQFGAPNVSPVTNSSLPTIQAQYPTGRISLYEHCYVDVQLFPTFDPRVPKKTPT